MELKPGIYSFDCFPMPWTTQELGADLEDYPIVISIELSLEEIQAIILMMHWAWNELWFENSTSELVNTKLLKKHVPHLYDKIQPLVHQQFINTYPKSDHLEGFGYYEIFCPDDIIAEAQRLHI